MNERSELIKPAKIGEIQSIWFKSVLSVLKRLTFDISGQLRVIANANITGGTVAAVTSVTQSNGAIGNTGLIATTVFSSNANFQGGGRRLIRKV